jgi:cytochrome c peroxidase
MRIARWMVCFGFAANAVMAGDRTDLRPTTAELAWRVPAQVPYPEDNVPSAARVALGKMLFFDPRLSGGADMSCASCHNPALGWSDGLPTGHGFHGKVLPRATPTLYNTAFNTIQMWDGRKSSLEDQATGPMDSGDEMAADYDRIFAFLSGSSGYRTAFDKAYPGEGINKTTLAKALASFERTVISNNAPFDRWLHGDINAMSPQQIRGFRIFTGPDKGNCEVCHRAPNFTDSGFHNIGLASFGNEDPDLGRYKQKPVAALKGAFKTPTLRNIALTAPYFHDGSAATLMDVVEHYVRGGDVKTNLSANLKPISLTQQEKEDLVAFMEALSSETPPITIPQLPGS